MIDRRSQGNHGKLGVRGFEGKLLIGCFVISFEERPIAIRGVQDVGKPHYVVPVNQLNRGFHYAGQIRPGVT